jgi:hypothetical protein
VTARKGISSYQLAKELGIPQKSSWFMGHRIRKACKNNDAILSLITLYSFIYCCFIGAKRDIGISMVINHGLNINAIDFIQFGGNEHAITRAHESDRPYFEKKL